MQIILHFLSPLICKDLCVIFFIGSPVEISRIETSLGVPSILCFSFFFFLITLDFIWTTVVLSCFIQKIAPKASS